MFELMDAQSALSFVEKQTSHIEAGVYRTRYPDIQYPTLIPIDTGANPWVTSVTFYSMEQFGKAEWLSGKADDIPYAGTRRSQFQTSVFMAGIGYEYSLEEVSQANMLGINLPAEDAAAARRAYEEFVDRVLLLGDTAAGFQGLLNYTGVPIVAAPNGASASPLWSSKTPDEVLTDINNLVTGVYIATNTVAMADTLLLPYDRWTALASRRIGDTGSTLLQFIQQNNAFTAQTGQPLLIRSVRQLNTAGGGGTARAVSYRRSPEVLKAHIPMPHRFLPVQQVLLMFKVPGIFRLGGLDIRLPKEVRYMDGI